MKTIAFLSILLCSGAVLAQDQYYPPAQPFYPDTRFYQPDMPPPPVPVQPQGAPGQSIMFQHQPGAYDHLTTMPKQQNFGDRCQQMARDIENLKGKPQRRYSLMQRYKAECELK